jgi:tRNA G18 (ribose-2'-O)-methylase SpoU
VSSARIASPDDPRVADYRNVRDGQLLRERDLFIVEGRANLVRLVRESPHEPRSIFLSDPAAAALGDVLAEVDASVPVFVATRDVLSEIAGFDIHRGCLAVCERPEPIAAESFIERRSGPSVVVVLEDLTNPDNVGTVFRNALAFGADAVLLSPRCCDPLYRKAVRVSMGAALCVPTARFGAWPEGLEALRDAGYTIVALDPAPTASPLAASRTWPARVALLFGTEGDGLSADACERADERVRIEMAKGFDSVNVATASGIALHDVFRAAVARGRPA